MTDHQARVYDLAEKLDFCMLVTKTSKGMRSRPMSSIVKRDAECIYFLSDTQGAKDNEIDSNPEILLAYSDAKSNFVSISAHAEILTDPELVKALWNPGAQAFWPEGPDASSVVVIKATPTGAEYWEGNSRIVSTVKFAIALATGTRPALGTNAKTAM